MNPAATRDLLVNRAGESGLIDKIGLFHKNNNSINRFYKKTCVRSRTISPSFWRGDCEGGGQAAISLQINHFNRITHERLSGWPGQELMVCVIVVLFAVALKCFAKVRNRSFFRHTCKEVDLKCFH